MTSYPAWLREQSDRYESLKEWAKNLGMLDTGPDYVRDVREALGDAKHALDKHGPESAEYFLDKAQRRILHAITS